MPYESTFILEYYNKEEIFLRNGLLHSGFGVKTMEALKTVKKATFEIENRQAAISSCRIFDIMRLWFCIAS